MWGWGCRTAVSGDFVELDIRRPLRAGGVKRLCPEVCRTRSRPHPKASRASPGPLGAGGGATLIRRPLGPLGGLSGLGVSKRLCPEVCRTRFLPYPKASWASRGPLRAGCSDPDSSHEQTFGSMALSGLGVSNGCVRRRCQEVSNTFDRQGVGGHVHEYACAGAYA